MRQKKRSPAGVAGLRADPCAARAATRPKHNPTAIQPQPARPFSAADLGRIFAAAWDSDPELAWCAQRLQALHRRVLYQLLVQLADNRPEVRETIKSFAAIDPEKLHRAHGDRMAPPPIHEVDLDGDDR